VIRVNVIGEREGRNESVFALGSLSLGSLVDVSILRWFSTLFSPFPLFPFPFLFLFPQLRPRSRTPRPHLLSSRARDARLTLHSINQTAPGKPFALVARLRSHFPTCCNCVSSIRWTPPSTRGLQWRVPIAADHVTMHSKLGIPMIREFHNARSVPAAARISATTALALVKTYACRLFRSSLTTRRSPRNPACSRLRRNTLRGPFFLAPAI